MRKLLIILYLINVSAVFPQHSREIVVEKQETVLSEIDNNYHENWDLDPFFEKIEKILREMNTLYKVLFLIMTAVILLFTFYKLQGLYLGSRYNADSYKYDKTGRVNSNKNSPGNNCFFEKALFYRDKEDYSNAIIQLHMGSLEYLYSKKHLESLRDYTNREIVRLLSNTELSVAFGKIAAKAEQITFNGAEGEEGDFEQLLNIYRSNFA